MSASPRRSVPTSQGPELVRRRLSGPALQVAPRLLGAQLITNYEDLVILRITEVEAYQGADDPGSHAYRGQTPRNSVMFGPPGHLYVYFTYGMHWCANVVCGPPGQAHAVLLRAGEVVHGQALARARRRSVTAVPRDRDLARGPARLTKAMGLTGQDDGRDLTNAASPVRLWIPARRLPGTSLACGPRVGVRGPGGGAERFSWRFWIQDEPTVSRYRPASERPHD